MYINHFIIKVIFLNACNFLLPKVGTCFPARNAHINDVKMVQKSNSQSNKFNWDKKDLKSIEEYPLSLRFLSSSKQEKYSINNDIVSRLKRSVNLTSEELGDMIPPENVVSPELLEQHQHLFSLLKTDVTNDFDRVRSTLSKLTKSPHIIEEETLSDLRQRTAPPEMNQASSFHSMQTSQVIHGTPQYMLDLFARFENNPFTQPASNIVRSFFNQATVEDQQAYKEANAACSDSCPRIHHLIFDIASVPKHERVTMAELRLFKIVERDRRKYSGIDRKVEVVEIIKSNKVGIDDNDNNTKIHRKILDSKRIIGRSSSWETFYITRAIRRWVKDDSQNQHELEVYIENISGRSDDNEMEFEQTSKSINEPLLVVFSDDTSRHHKLERREELQELLRHDGNDIPENVGSTIATDPDLGFNLNSFESNELSSKNSLEQSLQRKKRSETKTDDREEQKTVGRAKRSAYSPCHLENMEVNFRDIGYDSWIISPSKYEAGHCVGTCDLPFHGINVSPHAVIQNWMHKKGNHAFKKPCCVPTKLGPISMLYFEKNALTYKYRYEGMTVLECGCR